MKKEREANESTRILDNRIRREKIIISRSFFELFFSFSFPVFVVVVPRERT